MHSAVAHPPDWREGCNSPSSPLSRRPWPCPLADGCCHVSPCAAQCGAAHTYTATLPLGAVGGGSAALRRPSHQRLSCFVRRYTRRQIHVCRSPSEPSRNLDRFARLTPKLEPSHHGAASEIYKATTKMKPKSRWLCRNNALPRRLPITPPACPPARLFLPFPFQPFSPCVACRLWA
jgi:hypothetical protein